MNKYVCVHGHFYQPPRENPWLEAIEPQDSAAPYHDWNARISAECYEPNTAARILDDKNWIVSITNNYSRISFNFGPTFLSWMEHKKPSVYRAILSADRESLERFGGHGSALAQAYNHVILPLASDEDKRLQVLWGLRDFEHRFRRKPEGMWLPETAVDGSGRDIYEKSVKPSKVTWERLGAHYAISSVFDGYPETTRLYCYDIEREHFETFETGERKLAVGCARLTSTITSASEQLSFAVLREGNHEITAEVRRGRHDFGPLAKAFHEKGALDGYFGDTTFGLSSLFGDEQRRIVDILTRSGRKDAEAAHQNLFANHQATIRFFAELDVPPPKALSVAAEVVLNGNLRRALVHESSDPETVDNLLEKAIVEGVPLDEASLAYAARESLDAKAERFFESPENLELLEELRRSVAVMLSLPFEVDLWKVQNLYFRFLTDSAAGSSAFQESFRALGKQLSIRHPRP